MKKYKHQIGSCRPEHARIEVCNFTQHESRGIMVKFITILLLATLSTALTAQVGVSADGSSPDPSAMMDLKSVKKGFLPPRLTLNERDAIANPAEGLIIYNCDHKALEVFNGSVWTLLSGGFLCGASQIVDADGNRYNTAQIGDQCWMAQNLNIGTWIDTTANTSDNDTIEKYCYPNTAEGCLEYGGLYQWDEMMTYQTGESVQGICPVGWHLPSWDEWLTLVNYLGGWVDAANKLKETGTQHWGEGNMATNSSGFTAIPCPLLYKSIWLGYDCASFFTSTENPEHNLRAGHYWIEKGVPPSNTRVESSMDYSKDNAMSVRCIKNL